MHTALRLAIAIFFAASAFPAFGQSAEETAAKAAEQAGKHQDALQQYTAALVKAREGSADDRRLREAIIRLALSLRPAPAVPEEAERRLARGRAAVKAATDQQGFIRAANEFQQAVKVAPWLADGYINLGVVLDKAGRYADAIRNLKLGMLAAPNDPDAKKIRGLVFEIEYRQEEATRAKSKADAERAAKADAERRAQERRSLLQKYAGEFRQYLDGNYVHTFRGVMRGERLEITQLGIINPNGRYHSLEPYGDIYQLSVNGTRVEGTYLVPGGRSHPIVGTIESDGSMRLSHKKTFAEPRNPLDKSLYFDRDHISKFKPPY